ncbi:MAG: HlyC/CorC family transporter [Dehalococcoidia bacterium]|nr:HlyC/CorC family transporter [Dehalococcoidia bacterium]
MDIDDSWLGVAIAFLGIVLLALVSAAEGGILGVKATREEHPFLERGLFSLTHGHTELNIRTLNVLLVSKTIAIAMAVASIAWLSFRYNINWLYLLALGVVTLFVLSVLQSCYLILTSRRPDSTKSLVGPTVKFLNLLMWPLSQPVQMISSRLASLSGVREKDPVNENPKSGESEPGVHLERDEGQMIRGVIRLEETLAREIMVPRIDVVAVEVKTPLRQVIQTILESGYSRIPVYEDSIDNIIGVLYAKDLLKSSFGNGSAPQSIKELGLRDAHFIPENKKVSDLLTELRQKRVHIAIVVDEYGGTAGLVTIEDLLEQIVGEIEDEYDPQEEVHIQRLADDDFIIDAKVDIEEMNEVLGTNIEKEDFDTIGGFVYSKLGKIPNNGDHLSLDGLTISVLSTAGRRIRKVRVTYHRDTADKEG